MKKTLFLAASLWIGAVLIAPAQTPAPGAATDGARFTADGKLQFPGDYRGEWIYLTSGLGMTYGPTQPAAGEPRFFDNVFVNPQSYRAFMKTGRWPDKTMFVLEIRNAEQKASINNGGQTQGPRVLAIESSVKDSRFPDGWGYFEFGGGARPIAQLGELKAQTENCYACHKANTAVENTFVQFYPTLMDVAQRLGTVKPTYDPNHKVAP
jgi:hypothetical protein